VHEQEAIDAVRDLLRGFSGYVQTEAKSVYEMVLPAKHPDGGGDDARCNEVPCFGLGTLCESAARAGHAEL
jgi:hypothetical protein